MNEKQIKFLEELINYSIDFGGDAGGPYCSNPEKMEELFKTFEELFEGLHITWTDKYKSHVKILSNIHKIKLTIKQLISNE